MIKKLRRLLWRLVLIVVIVGGLILFWPSGPYRPVPQCHTLSAEQDLIVFLADMQIGRTRLGSKTAVWAFDVRTGELTQWDAARGLSIPILGIPTGYPAAPFYPADNSLIFRHSQDEITVLDENGAVNTLVSRPEWKRGVFSPNREFIAYINDDKDFGCELIVQEMTTLKIAGRVLLDNCHITLSHITWAPDSERIAFVNGSSFTFLPSNRAVLYSVRPDGTELTQLSPALIGGIYSLAWSPNSEQIAFSQTLKSEEGQAQLWVVDAAGGEPEALLPPQCGTWVMYEHLAWSPDGQQIAYIVDGMLGVKRADSLGIVTVMTGETAMVIDGTGRDYWYEIDALAWAPGDVPVIIASLPEDELLRCIEIHGSNERIFCSSNLYLVDPETGALTQLTRRQFWGARSKWLTWWR